MRYVCVCLVSILPMLSGCPENPTALPAKPGLQVPIPDTKLISNLPAFASQVNEVEIADTMNDVDPTWVLGSIVSFKSGKVRGLDNYLSQNAKPAVTPQTDVVFKDLIENSVAANAAWLDFLRAQLNDKVRAELSVIKTSKVTIKQQDVDKQKLTIELQKISKEERADYGLIIGYVNFVLSATLFKEFGGEAAASGYGAKIGGSWFTKFENTSAHHRVIAIWTPLPFVVDQLKQPTPSTGDLETQTSQAIKKGTLGIKPFGEALEFKAYVQKRRLDV